MDKNNLAKVILDSNAFKNISCIGIAGSIGRGEKTIEESTNDVDFFVVADSQNVKEVSALERSLNITLSTKFTDIAFFTSKKFKTIQNKKKLSQFHFDLLNGHLIIYPLELKLKMQAVSVKESCAAHVLYTRLWCLLGPFRMGSAIENKIVSIAHDFSLYQLNKAYSAIIDAISIKTHLYKTTSLNQKILMLSAHGVLAKDATLLELSDKYLEQGTLSLIDYCLVVKLYVKYLKHYGFWFDSVWNYPFYKNILKSVIFENEKNRILIIQKRLCLLEDLHTFCLGQSSCIDSKSLNKRLLAENKEVVL